MTVKSKSLYGLTLREVLLNFEVVEKSELRVINYILVSERASEL